LNREQRLARELDGTGLEYRAAELAGLPVSQVDLIVMIARASRRAGREHERQVRRQRVANRRRYGHVEDGQQAAATQRQALALARRAGSNLDTLARLAEHYADAPAVLGLAVAGLRARDYPWADIGSALGVTRQSAWERFGRQGDPDTGLAETRGTA
jgi:hypothetical protein